MPNFKIRRRRKVVDPPPPPNPPQEEKVDHMEESMSDSSEEAAIDAALNDLSMTKLQRPQKQPSVSAPPQQRRPQVPAQPQYYRPQYQNPANVVRQQPNPASYPNRNPGRSHIPNQYTRNPTMQIQNPRSKRTQGGAKLRFTSHYGAGGEHLDTRTKSILLYNHCFA